MTINVADSQLVAETTATHDPWDAVTTGAPAKRAATADDLPAVTERS
jgi:hypothetical protein